MTKDQLERQIRIILGAKGMGDWGARNATEEILGLFAKSRAVKALDEFIRIDGFISMHEMFEKDWEPAMAEARAAVAELRGKQ